MEVQQHKLLYMGLYLLIWGEAANLRFMPECLCYIYHHMAFELYGMLAGNVSHMTGVNIQPAYRDDEEAFPQKIVTPIYQTIAKAHKPSISFCQSCGGPTRQVIPDGEERTRAVCTLCGKIHYENPMMVGPSQSSKVSC